MAVANKHDSKGTSDTKKQSAESNVSMPFTMKKKIVCIIPEPCPDPNAGLNQVMVALLNKLCFILYDSIDDWNDITKNQKAVDALSGLFRTAVIEYKWNSAAAFEYLNHVETRNLFVKEYKEAYGSHPMIGFMSLEKSFGVYAAKYIEQISAVTTHMAKHPPPLHYQNEMAVNKNWDQDLAKTYLSLFKVI